MDHSLNTARQVLRIGKVRLYNYLDILGIEPALNGNSKLISNQQLEQIRQAIEEEVLSQKNSKNSTKNKHVADKTVSEDKEDRLSTNPQNNQNTSNIYSDLRDEIDHLRKMLALERQERIDKDSKNNELLKQFNESTERFQAMLLQVQNKNNELSQKLLESPKNEEKVSHDVTFKEVEEAVAIETEAIPMASKGSGIAATMIWAAVAVVATVSVIEFGGMSVGDLVRDLLASR